MSIVFTSENLYIKNVTSKIQMTFLMARLSARSHLSWLQQACHLNFFVL